MFNTIFESRARIEVMSLYVVSTRYPSDWEKFAGGNTAASSGSLCSRKQYHGFVCVCVLLFFSSSAWWMYTKYSFYKWAPVLHANRPSKEPKRKTTSMISYLQQHKHTHSSNAAKNCRFIVCQKHISQLTTNSLQTYAHIRQQAANSPKLIRLTLFLSTSSSFCVLMQTHKN